MIFPNPIKTPIKNPTKPGNETKGSAAGKEEESSSHHCRIHPTNKEVL
jgi:hypothetical protein